MSRLVSLRKRLSEVRVEPALLEHIRKLGLGTSRGEDIRHRRTLKVPEHDQAAAKERALGRLRPLCEVRTEGEIPAAAVAELALAGRSNVGKSSLLNALAGKRSSTSSTTGLAKVKNLPGVTRSLNFYGSQKQGARLVDMPGYGFAFAPDGSEGEWQQLMRDYVLQRGEALRLLMCVDSRQSLRQLDRDFLLMLDRESGLVPVHVVMTKCDLVTPRELAQRYTLMHESLGELRIRQLRGVHMVSSRTMAGVAVLRKALAADMPEGWLRKPGGAEDSGDADDDNNTGARPKPDTRAGGDPRSLRGASPGRREQAWSQGERNGPSQSPKRQRGGVKISEELPLLHPNVGDRLEKQRRKTRVGFDMWVRRQKKRSPAR